jgi:ABC-type Fe3+-hydroxamate transport system substrate-binding protein
LEPLTKIVKDDLQREISIPFRAKRIVSCVPSISEFIWDLGLKNELIGITKFCVHPKSLIQTKEIIGGTKQLKIEKIKSLNPDLVIANKEENIKSEIEEISKFCPVYVTDINSIKDAAESLFRLSIALNKEFEGVKLKRKLDGLHFSQQKQSCLYFIWKKPYMLAGNDTYISSMLKAHGYENILKENRYPSKSVEVLKNYKPSAILLSSEPYPFNQKHLQEFQDIFPDSEIKIVDGERFSWYGTRILHLEGLI